MQKVAIVIPVYKEICHDWEKFALERCSHILNRYQIIFFGPQTMKYDYYLNIVKDAEITTFDDRFFTSIESYSDLLLSKIFYESFLEYQYILIYQLDAFVFEDKLSDWCDKNYDYIGAPWFKDYGQSMAEGLVGVGNGGFCLRNPRSCLEVLNSIRLKSLTKFSISQLSEFVANKFDRSSTITPVEKIVCKYVKNGISEDLFWGWEAVKFYPSFNVSPIEDAIYFSFETGVQYIHEKYIDRSPFGCHAAWNVQMIYSFYQGQSPESDYERCLHQIIERFL